MAESSLAPCPCGAPATCAVWLNGQPSPRCNTHAPGSAEHAACRVEVAALKERAERAEKELKVIAKAAGESAQDTHAAEGQALRYRLLMWEAGEKLEAAEARVALLEGLLRKNLSAFLDGEQWWRSHSGRCALACPDGHRCCALYDELLAALPAAARGEGA